MQHIKIKSVGKSYRYSLENLLIIVAVWQNVPRGYTTVNKFSKNQISSQKNTLEFQTTELGKRNQKKNLPNNFYFPTDL